MVHLENILKISLQDVLKMSWRRLEDFLRTSWRRTAKTNILVLTKTSWRRLEDVFWRRKVEANIFILIRTFWRRLEDVFWRQRRKTSSRRFQDVLIKKNVCWIRTFKTLHPPKRHVFPELLVEKKTFHFSNRAQRVGTARNKWLKKVLSRERIYQKIHWNLSSAFWRRLFQTRLRGNSN